MITQDVPKRDVESARATAMGYTRELQQLEAEGVLEFEGYFPLKPNSRKDFGFSIRLRGQSEFEMVPTRAMGVVIRAIRAALSLGVPEEEL